MSEKAEKPAKPAPPGAMPAKANDGQASARRRHIYRKTPAGEEAIVRRAKVEERQQRMILVLIDGKASVQELSAKIGDAQLTEEAIAALEKSGLIEFDRIAEDAPPADASSSGASSRLSHFSTFGERSVAPLSVAPLSLQGKSIAPSSAQGAPSRMPGGARAPSNSLSSAQTVLSSAPVPPAARSAAPPPAPLPPLVIRSTALSGKARPEGAATAAALVLPAPIPDPDPEPELPLVKPRKPLRETHPRAYVWLRYSLLTLGASALGVLLVAAFVLLYPYNGKRSELERRLAQVLGVPVSISQITPQFSDWRLELRQVRFGAEQQGGHLDVVFLPGVFSWLFFEKPGSADDPVELFDGALEISAIIGWLGGNADIAPDWLRLERVTLTLGGNPLAVFAGELRRDAAGRFLKAELKSTEPMSRIELTPAPSPAPGKAAALAAFALEVSDWQPSAQFPAHLSNIAVKGKLYADRLIMEEGTIFLLGGHYSGQLEVGWQGNGVVERLRGQGMLTRVQAAELMRAWGIANEPGARGANLRFTGDLSGSLRFQTQGETLTHWRRNLNAAGEIKADSAILQGINLTRLIYSGNRGVLTHNQNAQTRFQKLSASFLLNKDGFLLQSLQSRSSVMHNEEGEIRVTPAGELSGYARLFLGDDNRLENTLLLNGRYPRLRTELTGPRNPEPEPETPTDTIASR
jgi:hypothetical protein